MPFFRIFLSFRFHDVSSPARFFFACTAYFLHTGWLSLVAVHFFSHSSFSMHMIALCPASRLSYLTNTFSRAPSFFFYFQKSVEDRRCVKPQKGGITIIETDFKKARDPPEERNGEHKQCQKKQRVIIRCIAETQTCLLHRKKRRQTERRQERAERRACLRQKEKHMTKLQQAIQ